MVRNAFVILLAGLTAAATAGDHAKGKKPSWYDDMLAGYALRYDRTHSDLTVHDPQTGYYLTREIECDGGFLTLSLTLQSKKLGDYGYRGTDPYDQSHIPKEKRLPSLATGKGVRIGDSPARTVQLLGRPSRRNHEGPGKRLEILTYKWQVGKGDDAEVNEQSYVFNAGRLSAIRFSRDRGA